MSIEIANESGQAADEQALLSVARHALEAMGVNPLAEMSLLLVDEAYMSELNKRWMQADGPTDVLAFPMDELEADRGPGPGSDSAEPALLGDVVLCPAVAARQARTAGHSNAAELQLLTVHGVLHLLGYDHADKEEERTMFGLQDRLLTEWRRDRRGDGDGAPGPDGAGPAADVPPDPAGV